MNIRFDNNANGINDNSSVDNKITGTAHNIDARNSNISKLGRAAEFSKANNSDGINAYGDKKSFKDATNEIKEMVGSQAATEAQIQKDYMVVMSNTVSDEDYKELEKNGFKVGSMTPKEAVTVVDEIKATMAKAGKVIAGYNDDLDRDKLAEITGSTAYANEISNATNSANASEIVASFNKYDVPFTNSNVKDAEMALNMAMEINSNNGLNDGAIKVLVENNMEPTIENVYMANHSSGSNVMSAGGYFMDSNGYLGKKSNELNDDIKNQVAKVVENAGYEVNDENVGNALKMLDEGMVLTEESFDKYQQFKNMEFPIDKQEMADKIAMNIKEGIKAKNTDLTRNETLLEKAEKLVDQVNSISNEAAVKVANEGKTLNLKNLAFAQKTIVINASIQTASLTATAKGYVATLNEVRLSMTVSSTYMLLKNGIDVNTEDLQSLVDELKEAGNRQFEALFGETFVADKAGIKELFDETTEKINELRNVPVATVGLMSARSAFSLNVLYEEGKTLENKYLAAGEKYEPLMTEVRGDLGDSIKKAFGNVPEILKELNMEVTAENEKAVRILGYTNQDITKDSIENVKEVYERVHSIIEKMTPRKTLDLIRNGINPLQTNLDELEEKLDMNPLSPVEEAERYSRFLYRMEKAGEISNDERESFIGIYRMLNAIEKDDGAAIGTLIATNGEINFKNLVSAVRTRNNKGIDTKIDDSFGGLDKLTFKNKTITEQIEKAFAGQNVELSDNNDTDFDREYFKENAELLRNSKVQSEDVVNLLIENNIAPTIDNIQSANEIYLNKGKIYRNIAKLSEKSTKNNKNVDKNVEKSADSRENVEKEPDFTENALDNLLDNFTDKESAESVFGQMVDTVENFLNTEAFNAGSSIDVRDIVTSMKQMSVVRGLMNNECYEVPAVIDGELTSIRVSVLHKDNQIPNVNVNLDTEKTGKVNASFGLIGNSLEGHIIYEKEEAFSIFKNLEEGFKSIINSNESVRENQVSLDRINYFKSEKLGSMDVNYFANKADINNRVNTKALYVVAKEFIKSISK